MKNRKSNRLKGYDYSKNNLYFITNCVKNNLCCLGRVMHVGTGRDLSVPYMNSHPDSDFNSRSKSESNAIFPLKSNPNPEFPPESNGNSYMHSDTKPDSYADPHATSEFVPEGNSIIYPKSYPEILEKSEARMEFNQFGLIVEERINWLMQQYPYVKIHNYQVMPNHFHFILEINDENSNGIKVKSVSSLLGALKTTSSKLIHLAGFLDFEWHRSFHDHIIRDERSYTNIFNYITNNPRNWMKDTFYSKS